MSDFVYHSNKYVEHYIGEYERFFLSLEEKFPGNPRFLVIAKAWLEKAQEFARKNGLMLTPPDVANTKDNNGIVFFWQSNIGIPFIHHDYGFFNDDKAGYYNRDRSKIIDYSDPNAWINWEDIPYANTVDVFSIPFEMAKLNNAA